MAVPTLPLIGVAPSILFFQVLEGLTNALVFMLLTMAAVLSSVMVLVLLIASDCKTRAQKQCQPSACNKCMKTMFLPVGRWLCVNTFPALFKIHKTRRDDGKTREFMVFLDRKVENNLALITAFCFIVFSIFSSSTKVFLGYFPVEKSTECLEKDSRSQSLFCYSNINSGLINPSLPVDCANYTVTELRELEFECYAITFPVGLGIAVAAALGLAKVGVVGVTLCVKITETFFSLTKNPPQKLQEARCRNCVNRKCANQVYFILSFLSLFIASAIIFVSLFTVSIVEKDSPLLHRLYYLAYAFLPFLITVPLVFVISYLSTHCDKGEYISFAAEQRPLHPRDWDEESGSSVIKGQHGETNRQGESDNINGEAPGVPEEMSIEIYENNISIHE